MDDGQADGEATQRCWACGTPCGVPSVDGVRVPLFVCGWCGALCDAAAAPPPGLLLAPPPPPGLLLAPPPPPRPRPLAPLVAGRALLAAAAALVLSVAAAAVWVVLPAAVPSAPARTLIFRPAAAVAVFNILFNYAAAVARHPGPVAALAAARRAGGGGRAEAGAAPVPRGAFANWAYCAACGYGKPPEAHHCRRCATCVVGMDHHCLYLGGCVGRGNARHFLLLLGWLAAGLAYAVAVAAALGWRERAAVRAHTARVWAAGRRLRWWARAPTFGARWLLARGAPPWMPAWGAVAAISAGALLSVSALLWRQVAVAARGETYLEVMRLQRAHAAALAAGGGGGSPPPRRRPRLDGLRRVFGAGPVWTWPLPRWGDVPPAPDGDGGKVE